MIIYKSIVALPPLFAKNETMTGSEWIQKLNIDEEKFNAMVDGHCSSIECMKYFIPIDSDIRIYSNFILSGVLIDRMNNPINCDDATKIIDNIKNAFPNLNDLLKEKHDKRKIKKSNRDSSGH